MFKSISVIYLYSILNTMAKKSKPKADSTTKEKIIEAARKLFTQQGYTAIKTRDIAKEAGINLALLNYYFRSKENLFEIVMKENFTQFIKGISELVNNEETSINKKIELLVANYIEMLSLNPDMPLFVLSHSKEKPQLMKVRETFMNSVFMKQVQQEVKAGKIAPINPANLVMNIIGLTIFPFIGRRIIQNSNGITSQQFNVLMQERKKMIPKWIEAMLKVK